MSRPGEENLWRYSSDGFHFLGEIEGSPTEHGDEAGILICDRKSYLKKRRIVDLGDSV